jgi:hypothetical protein
MGRLLYLALLRLHPRPFRERFGEEMIGIFDEEQRRSTRIALLLDAVVSVTRQWTYRPARRKPALSAILPVPSGVPVFHTFDSSLPRRSALVHGAVLSLIFFAAVTFAISRGGASFPRLLIGAKYLRPHVLPVDRSSVEGAEPTTEIKVKASAAVSLDELARVYFKIVRVLAALDADGDRIISAREIATARSPLIGLDSDRNGELSARECGFSLGANLNFKGDPEFQERAQMEFMRSHPVLASLDADRNGRISADEINRSSAALEALDQNRDGRLVPAEVFPEPVDQIKK